MSTRKRYPHGKKAKFRRLTDQALSPPGARPGPPAFPIGKKDAEQSLRDKITSFAYEPRFGRDFDRALGLYFGEAVRRQRVLVYDEEEMPGFQEWYIHDFVMADGRRLIDRFADEIGPDLPEAEAKWLAAWRAMNRLRLFEIQSVEPGMGVVVRDLLNDEVLTINDRSASRTMRRWMIMLARPHQAEDRVCFTGISWALTPFQKDEMLGAARRLWDDCRARRPEATLSDFYRDHGLDLLREVKRLQEKARRPPVVITPEGHSLVDARAVSDVLNSDAVRATLSEAEEFNYAGHSTEHPDALHFNWLLRGRSHVPENPDHEEGALMHTVEWTAGPGEPSFRSLGDIALWKNRLELSCLSRERLEAGKALLAEVLGGLIRHRRDRVKPLEVETGLSPEGFVPLADTRIPRAERLALEREARDRQTTQWLDTPLPALNNLSPRQAVKTPEGRAEVLEMLKVMEYIDDGRREAGEPSVMDIARIHRELRLS
ncbi:MAG: DUF2384 domain-containing protein [Chloroflexi bacterium]|nr:DUF2384 domain-containing protein [Chloroflexota bacterium]MBI3764645.1 DUF2384 domain-containing protein [Chloroflexota bacterium]